MSKKAKSTDSESQIIHGFKGFGRNMQCRGYQFAEGGTYKHGGPVKCCPDSDDIAAGKGGFHLCENPLDVFHYYEPGTSVFHEVTGSGETEKNNEDSKVACTEIKIATSLKLHDFIGASIKFLFSRKYNETTSNHTNKDRSASSATGYSSASVCTGLDSNGMVGKYGCIVLAWWNETEQRGEMRCAETGCGDGSDGKLKADVWYRLDGIGQFVECGQ